MTRTWGVALIGMSCVVLGNACSDDQHSPGLTHRTEDGGVSSSDATSQVTSTDASATFSEESSVTSNTAQNPDTDADVDGTAGEVDARVEPPLDAGAPDGSNSSDGGALSFELPPVNGGLDYQLGGAYELPDEVTIVSRDRTDEPEPGAYNICYVNGFQVQPGEEDDWEPDLLLRDDNGDLIIDEDWNEVILDVSTDDKRTRIAAVVGAWIEQCASDGFQAVEIDNLDTYTRSDDRIDEDDAVDFIARLSAFAHHSGLAIAQKNSVELVPRREEMGTDFVVSEECNAWEECDGYIEAYGAHVLMIEYGEADFERGCDLYGEEFSIVYRDKKLTTPNSGTYVFEGC